jgi:hypothetical protein
MPHYWGAQAADPAIETDQQKLPGDIYFNTTTRQMKMVDAARRVWMVMGAPKIFDDFTDSALDIFKWAPAVAGTGAVIPLLAGASYVNGAIRLLDSGIVGDNHAQISAGTNRSLRRDQLTLINFRIQLSDVAAAQGTRIRAILHNIGAFNAGGDWAGFEVEVAAGPNWRIRSSVGGAAVVDVNTGVQAVAGSITDLAIMIYQNAAYLYINGVYVGTISVANLTAVLLEPLVYIDDGGAIGGPIACDVDLIAAY